jgi:hypothetical protein
MSLNDFENVLDTYANKELFEKFDSKWRPKFRAV